MREPNEAALSEPLDDMDAAVIRAILEGIGGQGGRGMACRTPYRLPV